MVQAVINISGHANRILSIVKAKYGLKNKSEAIDLVAEIYEEEAMQPEIRPEYIRKIKGIEKEKTVKVRDFAKRYGLK